MVRSPDTGADDGSRRSVAAFGLSLVFDCTPPGAWSAAPQREPRLEIRRSTPEAIAGCWSGTEAIGWEGVIDGAAFVVERGLAGDHRFVHGAPPGDGGSHGAATRAVHHLCTDASTLRCAPANPSDLSWWRVVLDSVLFTVALLRGYEALHAGAIATPDGVVAITAASGGGKSTLLAELLGRGLKLVADDVLVLQPRGSRAPLAHPAPPLMTVPVTSMPLPASAEASPAISSIGDERWIAVPAHQEAMPLRALVVLDRRSASRAAGGPASLKRIESPLAPLLGALMSFPRTPERQRTRFELASTLTATTGLWRLTADSHTSPDALAEALLSARL
ncbi:MAG TPA: hypothetical protein VK790_09265 [Solirubrobacteraceae bacterium]|jgi:hypothetical protein|nr:hypothetical protein [Solirubrobacteraceae bacterium]